MKRFLQRFQKHKLGMAALFVILLFFLVGTYAPFFASSKPFFVVYDGTFYFPLFRYLLYQGFYSKSIDLFFNLLMFTLPLILLLPGRFKWAAVSVQVVAFTYFSLVPIKDPAAGSSPIGSVPDWEMEMAGTSSYRRLNLVLQYIRNKQQHERLKGFSEDAPILWNLQVKIDERQQKLYESESDPYADAKIIYNKQRRAWFENESKKVSFLLMPLIRDFHWEEDAGGDQQFNRKAPFFELTRTNRKDFVSSLLFGIRISLVVGVLSSIVALAIGIPIGAFAGYFGGRVDIVVCRLLEIWESMPTFFMLLLIVAMTESKSIFLVIGVVGIFGWTGISRYVRAEFFKQRNLPYVEALRAAGFGQGHIMFSEILPNALPPVFTLLPFAIMGAISTEAGLSFLGLGEEGSSSWGVLMDEGRGAFPAESYLLWPPALMLTIFLVAIALAGDALRDVLDPRASS